VGKVCHALAVWLGGKFGDGFGPSVNFYLFHGFGNKKILMGLKFAHLQTLPRLRLHGKQSIHCPMIFCATPRVTCWSA
jgi:hypothetical protein